MKAEVVRAFAASIFAKVRLVADVDLTRQERQRVLEAISGDIRKFTDLVEPLVSDAAQSVAIGLGIDLRTRTWHDQKKVDPDREQFLWEHLVPVSEVRTACLQSTSEEEVAAALRAVRVAWVLREEDRRLTSLGYRSKRPDPDAAYEEAGITFLEGETLLEDEPDL